MIKRKFIYTLMLAMLLVGVFAAAAAATAVSCANITGPTSVTLAPGTTKDITFTLTGDNPTKPSAVKLPFSVSGGGDVATPSIKSGAAGGNTDNTVAANGTATVVVTITAGATDGTTTITAQSGSQTATVSVAVKAGGSTPQKPKFDDDAEAAATEALAGTYGTPITDYDITVTSESDVEWTVTGLPKGYEYAVDDEDTTTLTISGTPEELTKDEGVKVIITAKNSAGSKIIRPTVKVVGGETYSEVTITGTLPAGDKILNEEFETPVVVSAEPGPIKWKVEKLPAGLTFTVSNDDGRYATISGTKYTKATTYDKKGEAQSRYTITATNPYIQTPAVESADLIVWTSPDITTKSLPNITIGKEWNAPLKFTGKPTAFTVTYAGLTAGEDTGKDIPGQTDKNNYQKARATGSCAIYFDPDDMTFKGSFDRFPNASSDRTFAVTVTAKNYVNENLGTDPVEKTFSVTVKGADPKLPSIKEIPLKAEGNGISIDIEAGTLPVTMSAYIATKDFLKLFGQEISADTPPDFPEGEDVSKDGYALSNVGLVVTSGATEDNEPDGTLFLKPAEDLGNFAFKNLPLTVIASGDNKVVKKVYKVNVESDDPKWLSGDVEITKVDDIVKLAGSETPLELKFEAKVRKPYKITASPEWSNGLTATFTDATADAGPTVTIGGVPSADIETKTTFTLTAQNTSTNKKAQLKFKVIGKYPVTITSKPKDLSADITLGKSVNIKPAAKGSKTISWGIHEDSETKEAELKEWGLTFDAKKGSITGTPKTTTWGEDGYTPKTITIIAYNDVSSGDLAESVEPASKDVRIGVKGAKPKFKNKSVTLSAAEDANETIKTDPEYDAASMTFSVTGLPAGLSMDNAGKITVETLADVKATKGATAKVTVNNAGTEATGNVKIIINDVKPVIGDITDSISITADPKKKKEEKATLSLTAGYTSDATKIKWEISKAPSKASAKIKAVGNGDTATLTLTVAKNLKNTGNADISDSVTITAKNTKTNEVSSPLKLDFTITPVPSENTALPDGSAIAEDEETFVALPDNAHKKSTGEGEVKLGQARTVAGLTAGERTIVNAEGYIIAAVLPEVTVTEDGQYDLNVELAEEVKEGAELKYFAFPRNAEASPDDEICDFYDEEGNEIEAVPASHKITVSPWFNANVTYAPVIAVKADTGAEGAKTAEEIEAEVTK